MFCFPFSDRGRLASLRAVLERAAGRLDARFCVELWDGSVVPLGRNADPNFRVVLSGPGVVSSLLRKPTLENFMQHYAAGRIDFRGGDLIAFGELARIRGASKRLRGISKAWLLWRALPFLFFPADRSTVQHRFAAGSEHKAGLGNNEKLIQFHYDLGNDFYKLFLGEEMQYSCGYFTDWNNDLDLAQRDKLEMICRKLRLRPGEKLLDVGCGWGGLVCYAARHYGVKAHGITLSREQLEFAREKVRRLGLEDRVTVDLRDYNDVEGNYDKIASIGMFEHVGIANHVGYFRKLSSLLRDRGILLNHSIARGAKASRKQFLAMRPEHRFIQEHVFPGSELDHIGHMLGEMESTGYEIHDVEGWREHYARTTRLWCQRLSAQSEEAQRLVGAERYRLWAAYLAGVSFAFADGSLRIFQVVASKHAAKGASEMPSTREHLYASPWPALWCPEEQAGEEEPALSRKPWATRG
jgi:cyclopropane-fatty-acyl-phospholipid synthase